MTEYIIECNYAYTDRNGKPCEEIVRCRDCKRFDKECGLLEFYFTGMEEMGFCAWGERKSESDNRTTELLPCPFCGGEASIYEEIPGGYIIQCHDCCGQIGIMTIEHAIAAWNARAERTCYVEKSRFDELWNERYTRLSCGHYVWGHVERYCPACGSKVMKQS